jgi:hypothetical protein
MNKMSKELHDFMQEVQIVVSLEEGDKMSSEEAYKDIKKAWKKLKKIHKETK